MVQPTIWGPPIWTLFHVLIERINDEEFPKLYKELFHYIKRICTYLPCPECSQHASQFLSKIKYNQNAKNYKNGTFLLFKVPFL